MSMSWPLAAVLITAMVCGTLALLSVFARKR
jgi:hypothetical protein